MTGSLFDASDDLIKARDLSRVVFAALSGGVDDPKESIAGCIWILHDIEKLVVSADESVDAALDAIRPAAIMKRCGVAGPIVSA